MLSKSRRGRASKLGALALMTAGLGILAAGCGSTPTAHPSTSSSKPTPGGTLIFAHAPQATYNWYLPIVDAQYDYNAGLYDEIYKPLLWVNNNYSKSSIANKITYNTTGTVYHIFLHKKWRWSNGTPVTSKDVLFTWNVIKAASASNAPSPWPYVGAGTGDIPNGIQRVTANGNYEVTITLKQPTNQQWFIYNGIIQLVPMPHVWDIKKNMTDELKYLGQEATNPHFVSLVDGPFKLGKVVQHQYWTLLPNQKYAGHKSILKKLILQYQGSTASELAALKTGAANMGYLDVSQWGSRRELTSQGDIITPEYYFAFFDTALNLFPGSPVRSIFKHLYVRQALQMGIDTKGIDQSVYHGFAPAMDGPLPQKPMTAFYDPALNTNPYPYNPKAAKKLLESHGWHEVNGVMTQRGQKLSFAMMYPTGTTSTVTTAQIMQQDWAKEGIQVSLKPVTFNNLISVASPGGSPSKWDMAMGTGWYYDGPGFYPSGDGLFNTNAPSGFGYSNSTEDALINATHKPYASSAANMQAFFRYEDFTARHLPVLWMNNPAALVVHAPTVHNSVKYADASPGIPQMQYWWVSTNK